MPVRQAVPENPTPFSDLADMWNRLDTFATWKYKHGPCTGKELAKSGFYYTSKTSAKCYYCDKELDNWEVTDVPHVEHRKHSPGCPYVVKFPVVPTKLTIRDTLNLERDRLIFLMRATMPPLQAENL